MSSTVIIPTWEKANLTIDEAAAYFGIGEKEIKKIVANRECAPLLLDIDGVRLIKRKAFESYLDGRYSATCDSGGRVVKSEAPYLENCIDAPDYVLFPKGVQEMATKINRTVTVGGERRWIHANTEQEYADKLAKLLGAGARETEKHNFSVYARNWYEVFSKPNIEAATAATYQRQLDLHLIPILGEKAIEDISTDDVQRVFNSMGGAKTTKQKAKVVLNMILETALDDGLIQRNPLRSRRVKITGASSKFTEEYTVEQMRYLIQNLDSVKNPVDRSYLALQALHPLRLEEVLGLQWGDIDLDNSIIHICRAVTHPTRNQPEVKKPKTEASTRDIALSAIAARHLTPASKADFVIGGKQPFSYQQVKRMCWRIKADTGFEENITPIRFRTTVLTDIYDTTKDVKAAQAAAGHTTSAMTLKHYIKGRSSAAQTAAAIDNLYSA